MKPTTTKELAYTGRRTRGPTMNNAIRNIDHDATRAFAEACYDTNSIEDLLEPSEDSAADKTDLENWQIDESQWHIACHAALNDLLHDWVLEYVEGCESNDVDPRNAIAEWANVAIEVVEIDEEGDIHTGHWLDVCQMADFVAWHKRTYS